MLERASTCVEPATQILLRSFERPVRSLRVLDPGFWRHATTELPAAAWWPLYLESVRGVAQSANPIRHAIVLKKPAAFRHHASRTIQNQSNSTRAFSKGADRGWKDTTQPRAAQQAVSRVEQEDVFSETDLQNEEVVLKKQEGSQSGVVAHPSPASFAAENELEDLLRSSDTDTESYDYTWQLFLTVPHQARFASRVLALLATSDHVLDLDHAQAAFNLITHEDRQKQDYDNAVEVAIKQNRYVLANKINVEAVSRGLGQDCGPHLLSVSLYNGLWRSAALTWTTTYARSPRADHAVSPDEDKRRWASIDSMLDLPIKLHALLQRLDKHDAVLAKDRRQLLRMSSNLLLRVCSSQKIMGNITGQGIIGLFDIARQLEIFRLAHCLRAFGTLLNMMSTRNRPELAFLVYRNLRFRNPTWTVPEWVYGAMTSISMQAEYSVEMYDYLLVEFGSMHGKPDLKLYQKVLTALSRIGDVDGVRTTFDKMVQHHGQPKEIGFYTPLLYTYSRVGDVEGAQKEFDNIHTAGFSPNIYCWNMLLLAHARSAHSGTAFGILDQMLEQNVRPDAHTFGTLMGLCANSGDTNAVHQLVDMARQHNIAVNTAMLDTLVHSYCLNDESEVAEEIVERACETKLTGSPTRMWNILLRHHAFQANSRAVLRLQERMREIGIKPDDMTYAALMSTLVLVGRTDDAAKVLRSLHLKQNLSATPFHYSIVLHGYAREENRDMATVIFNEMLERFPRLSPSSKLAMLRVHGQRDSAVAVEKRRKTSKPAAVDLSRALEFLTEVCLDTNTADMVTKDPQPGLGKRSPGYAVQSIYLEFLVRLLAAEGRVDQADELLTKYASQSGGSFATDNSLRESLNLLVVRMTVAARKAQWTECDDIWRHMLNRALDISTTKIRGGKLGRGLIQSNHAEQDPAHTQIPTKKSAVNVVMQSSSMTRQELQASDGSKSLNDDIIPAQRFVLSAALNRYMQVLSAQNRIGEISQLVNHLQELGFALTGKNWNAYVQHLCRSGDSEAQIHAFEIFERVLQPNSTYWKLHKRGKWVDRSVVLVDESGKRSHPGAVERKKVERLRPGLAIPTYFTTVYLASILVKFHRLSLRGTDALLKRLEQNAPLSLNYVKRIPYLRDRIQGVLLRGQRAFGDPEKRPRMPAQPNRAGIRGSKSPLDHLSVEELEEIETALSPMRLNGTSDPAAEEKYSQAFVELLSQGQGQNSHGEQHDTPRRPINGNPRISEQRSSRVPTMNTNAQRTLEQMRKGLNEPRIVNNPVIGDPHIDSVKSVTSIMRALQQSGASFADLAVEGHEVFLPTEPTIHEPTLPSAVVPGSPSRLTQGQETSHGSDKAEGVRSGGEGKWSHSIDQHPTSILRKAIPPKVRSNRETKAFSKNKEFRAAQTIEKRNQRQQIARGNRLQAKARNQQSITSQDDSTSPLASQEFETREKERRTNTGEYGRQQRYGR